MSTNTDELSEFIRSTLKGIKKGIEGEKFYLTESVKFDVAVAKIKEGSGGFKLHVVDVGGKYRAEEITKIQFEIHPDVDNFACGTTLR